MSYEHCDKHDEDATNGCPSCGAEALMEKCREGGRRAIAMFKRLNGEECPEEFVEPMTLSCALVFLDGLGSCEGQFEPSVISRVRTELETRLKHMEIPVV